jgi:sulfatase-like protein
VPPMSRRPLVERGLHIAVLWALAVAGPLFRLIADHPEVLGVRGSAPGEIVAIAVVVTFAPPAALLAVEWLAGLAGDLAAATVHLACVAGLVGVIAVQLAEPGGVAAALVLALAAGAPAAWAYARWVPARAFLTVLGPAPLVFLALFLFFSAASDLVFADVQATHVKATAPIVLVILDELPVQSLMAADGRIDAARYPNFARLARDSTWYRDTASVDQDTPYAVPAILDGRLPRKERLPVAADHPRNIFSLLAGRYQLHVREDATQLCAPRLCAPRSHPPLWRALAHLYGHGLLPDQIDDGLPEEEDRAVADTRVVPRETKRHRYVRLHRNLARGRPQRFERFVSDIVGGRRPRLHLIHILLPHVPFQYLPSGRFYRATPGEALPGLEGRPGYAIPFLVQQAYQRHLLQLEATDRLLGELLDRLHEVGIYDRALVAVVADHGISFRLGHDRRLVRRASVQEIAPVPFFLKAPGQHRGRLSDKPLETIDVLPTIADELGIRIPWKVDGRSALLPARANPRRTIEAKKFKHTYLVDTPSYEARQQAALARKLTLFGSGHDDIYAFGPRPDLIGDPAPAGGRTVVVGDSGLLPTHVTGSIAGGRPGGGRTVAIAVNGRVVATGTTFTLAGARTEQYSVLIPERALHAGRNRVQVLLP